MRRRQTRPALVILTGILFAGCGSPLADGTYPGEPLLLLEGTIEHLALPADDEDHTEIPSGTLRMAVFWSRGGLANLTGAVSVADQQAVTRGSFPARFTMAFHHAPPDEVLSDAPGGGRIVLGLVIAYVDVDGDGAWSPSTDRIVGGALRRKQSGSEVEREGSAVVYTPGGATDPSLGGTYGPGFHRVGFEAEADHCGQTNAELKVESVEGDLVVTLDPSRPTSALLDLNCDGVFNEFSHVCPEGGIAAACPGWTCQTPGAGTCDYAFCCETDSDDD